MRTRERVRLLAAYGADVRIEVAVCGTGKATRAYVYAGGREVGFGTTPADAVRDAMARLRRRTT